MLNTFFSIKYILQPIVLCFTIINIYIYLYGYRNQRFTFILVLVFSLYFPASMFSSTIHTMQTYSISLCVSWSSSFLSLLFTVSIPQWYFFHSRPPPQFSSTTIYLVYCVLHNFYWFNSFQSDRRTRHPHNP